jgi:tetratricopeptide (TPR) repeat protein
MIFISYRREDTKAEVTNLALRLKARYGQQNVFVDFSDIAAGADWPDTIRQQLEAAKAILGVIGPRWGDARFPPGSGKQTGRLRLDDPQDWVRQELCTAIRRWQGQAVSFIVLAVDGAQLPETGWHCELDHLPEVQQAPLRNQNDFEGDFARLCEALEASVPSLREALGKAQAAINGSDPGKHEAAMLNDTLPLPPARYAVPAYIGSHEFVGRDAELALLKDWSAAEDGHPLMLFDAIGGSGKSMLTWHWFEQQAPARREWAGRFWYSFYEPGASMADCCRHALAYITRRPLSDFQKKSTRELTQMLVARLRERPWLLVLDGLERVLVAYHRSDAATIADEALDTPTDQIAERNPCTAAHPDDDELLRQLSDAGPSKLLVSSRLMPQALLNRANQPIPGVRRESLRGLRPEDAVHLLQRCGVRGDAAAMQRFVQAHCDGHPLVVGALAGLIVAPWPAAGDFDAWVSHPTGGAALDLGALNLVQKRNHILRAAIAAVPEQGRELLATLALVHGGLDRVAIEALNPHTPAAPAEVPEPKKPQDEWDWKYQNAQQKAERQKRYQKQQAQRAAYLKAHAAWQISPALKAAPGALAATLGDLQRRGLLQMGEGREQRFDLHPVVRGIVSAGLAGDATERLGQRVVDHFSRQAHNPYEQAQTLQELEGGFHLVRTLLRMGRFQQALDAWQGDLSRAVLFNILAWHEMLALLKPFFPDGWLQPLRGVDERAASYLMNGAATALKETGLREQAIQVFGASLRLHAARRDASDLFVGLSNLARALQADNRLAEARACRALALRVAEISGGKEELFRARLDVFVEATLVGDWPRAEALWAGLDGMGRNWPRATYRPGEAEFWLALNFWWQSRSPAEPLAAAERLARSANARGELRRALELHGQWRLAESDAAAAVAAFDESARLARASGLTDLDTECWLALARQHAGQLDDPRAEAERLQAAGAKGYALARLWQAAGDLVQAGAQALTAYHRARADGEPYVRRFDLDRTRQLLAELGEPEPQLPPYDPASFRRFDWQDEVEAAIAEIERKKAERGAKEGKGHD